MSGWNFWVRAASSEEQGSFCDEGSQIHYQNLSKEEAEERIEGVMRAGGGTAGAYNVEDYPNHQRFNVTEMEVDNEGYDHPAKHGPKKHYEEYED